MKKKIIIWVWLVLFSLFLFAWLTKAWIIPNYLDLEILCSWEDKKSNKYTYQPQFWDDPMIDYKPVIYLYPEEKTDIKVKLDYKWEIFADYPEYNKEIKWWEVTAYPDSKIINKADNKEYSYLFWEWKHNEKINRDISKWFVVKWEESREFLQEVLPKIWLTPKEYNEFIVYWYPIMQKNKYNLIHFADNQYTNTALLETTPKYDSLLRVFMVFKALDEPIKIEPQEFKTFERKWFTIVEWWWTQIK